MSAPIATFSSTAIYLDTMLPYALLRGIDPAVKPLFQKIQQGDVIAYTFVLTFDELAYRLLLALIKDKYGGAPLDQLRVDEPRLIAEFALNIGKQLQLLSQFPNLIVLDVLVGDLNVMNHAMQAYQLRPRDALHWSAMQRVGCLDLASNDQHFDRVPALRRFAL